MTNPITQAISYCDGSITELARRVGVTYQAIRKFENTRCPAERVFDICAAVDWHLTPYMVRPDLYPDPDWLPPSATHDNKGATTHA